jgi:hypothetical protein
LKLDLFLAWFSEVKRGMDKAQRLQFIRARFRRNRLIQEPVPKSAPQTQKQAHRFHPYGLGNPKDLPMVGAQRIYAPREGKDTQLLKPRRIKRKSPLVKIAEHYFKRPRRQ